VLGSCAPSCGDTLRERVEEARHVGGCHLGAEVAALVDTWRTYT
jgi:hypothetical protein